MISLTEVFWTFFVVLMGITVASLVWMGKKALDEFESSEGED